MSYNWGVKTQGKHLRFRAFLYNLEGRELFRYVGERQYVIEFVKSKRFDKGIVIAYYGNDDTNQAVFETVAQLKEITEIFAEE